MTAMIRPATKADLPQILGIYNRAVAETTAIWNDQTVDLAEREAWFSYRIGRGFPVLVAEADGTILGYASYGEWRSFAGFRDTVENSVYVAPGQQGRGLGKLLLGALIDAARGQGRHVMIAGIEAGNRASIRLHAGFGFQETARMPQVGQKFGHWLDLVFMQLKLDDRPLPPTD